MRFTDPSKPTLLHLIHFAEVIPMTAVPPDNTAHVPPDPVAGKTVAEILGEIVWLMTQDPAGREMKVSDIEQLIMPAILQRRFHIKYANVPVFRRLGETTLQPAYVEILEVGKTVAEGSDHKSVLAAFGFKAARD